MASNRTVAILAVAVVAGMVFAEYAVAHHWIPDPQKAFPASSETPAPDGPGGIVSAPGAQEAS